MAKAKFHAVPDNVADVLRWSDCSGKSITLPEQLDRETYVQVDKVLKAMGGKWSRGAKAHIFADDVATIFADVLSAGKVLDEKKTYQFFETPSELAIRMVAMAQIATGDIVLEPSAGRGAILRHIPHSANTVAVELNPKMVEHLKATCPPRPFEVNEPKGSLALIEGDFLQLGKLAQSKLFAMRFDAIVMNPPFSELQDVEHVMHAYDLLSPGGRLVAVMSPAGWSNSTKKAQQFREWLGGIEGAMAEQLPEGTFKESGTGVNTMLLFIRKDS